MKDGNRPPTTIDAPDPPVVLAPTITTLPPGARGAVVVSGSHGGRYSGYLAARAGVRAVVLNDAGIGKDEAGIGSLAYLDACGIAGATLSHDSCRIGDPDDMLARGVVSRMNGVAAGLGVSPGLPCAAAIAHLRRAPWRQVEPHAWGEARTVVPLDGARRPVVLVDSAALVDPVADRGAIVVAGSHGGLVGGDPAMAIHAEAFAAVFNDAGIGIDGAGTGRLPALDRRGIAAFVVAAASARIGEARSTFEDGIVSVVNETARAMGARPGDRARDVITRWATAP